MRYMDLRSWAKGLWSLWQLGSSMLAPRSILIAQARSSLNPLFLFFFFARVQPQQDPGVPSGWMELARERERDGETKLRWSRSVTLFLKRAFIPWVVHRGGWKMQSHAGSAVLTLIETRLSFCIPFYIQRSYVIYILFWPGGLLTFYDLFFW